MNRRWNNFESKVIKETTTNNLFTSTNNLRPRPSTTIKTPRVNKSTAKTPLKSSVKKRLTSARKSINVSNKKNKKLVDVVVSDQEEEIEIEPIRTVTSSRLFKTPAKKSRKSLAVSTRKSARKAQVEEEEGEEVESLIVRAEDIFLPPLSPSLSPELEDFSEEDEEEEVVASKKKRGRVSKIVQSIQIEEQQDQQEESEEDEEEPVEVIQFKGKKTQKNAVSKKVVKEKVIKKKVAKRIISDEIEEVPVISTKTKKKVLKPVVAPSSDELVEQDLLEDEEIAVVVPKKVNGKRKVNVLS